MDPTVETGPNYQLFILHSFWFVEKSSNKSWHGRFEIPSHFLYDYVTISSGHVKLSTDLVSWCFCFETRDRADNKIWEFWHERILS